MPSSPLGANNRILRIDLGRVESHSETIDPVIYRRFVGGSLLATYLLLRETEAGLDPFDPAAPLMFMSSAVAGHEAVGLPRFSVVGKSPMTGGVGEARAEGPWGVALKRSGYDGIAVTGRSTQPVYVLIEDGVVHIVRAPELWGLDTSQTADQLQQRHGAETHVAAIGPAGERRVRFASIVADRKFQAARMGLGAVMGSKQLKAIAIVGGKAPAPSDAERLKQITRSYAAAIPENPLTRWQKEAPGFASWIEAIDFVGYMGLRNFSTSRLEEVDAYSSEEFVRYMVGSGSGACPGCPNDCIKDFQVPGITDPRAGGLHQEAVATLGPNLGVNDLEVVLRGNELCHLLGLDPVSLGYTLSFVMEASDNGAISPDATDAAIPKFGDGEAILDLAERIAYRDGLGDVLAEGSRRAASVLGEDAERYAMHVKSLEMVSFDPRCSTGMAIGYATAATGPRYDICEHDWDFDPEAGWSHTLEGSRALGIYERIEMGELSAQKIRNYVELSTLWSGCDALLLCIFASPPTRALSLDTVSNLVSAVTGWETSSYELMQWGRRRLTLMRQYNLREGLTSADDTLPARFFEEPVDAGRYRGRSLDSRRFAEMVRLYYSMMGWDTAGVPTPSALVQQQLEDVHTTGRGRYDPGGPS